MQKYKVIKMIHIKTKNPKLSNNIYKVAMFALPISASVLIYMCSNFVAMFFVARLGQLQLAAAALAITTYLTIMTIVTTVFYAIAILISNYKAQGKSFIEMGALVKNGLWLAAVFTILSAIILWNMDQLLLLFRQDPQLVKLTHDYFHYAALVMLPTLMTTVIVQFYTGIGKPHFTFITASISLPVMVVLSYALVLGKFGCPQLSLAGVSCAAFIVQSVMCVCLLTHMFMNPQLESFHIFSGKFLPNLSLCKIIFTLGMPIGMQFGSELAAMTAATYLTGYFGVVALAASQIVAQYNMLIVGMTIGLSQATSMLISSAYGKGDTTLVKQYIKSAILILLFIFTWVLTLFYITPHYLISLYINISDPNNSALVKLATYFFMISGIMLFVDAIRNIFSDGLRGLHDTKTPMLISSASLWVVSLPACYFFGFVCHGGPIGLRVGFASGFFVAAWVLWKKLSHKLESIQPAKNLNLQVLEDSLVQH